MISTIYPGGDGWSSHDTDSHPRTPPQTAGEGRQQARAGGLHGAVDD
ncbi:MAG TPA: hypothetical protein VFL17_08975 [Anaerolineae bacterium]|nr:hypothetical protein [Anaerolineae bacterium]